MNDVSTLYEVEVLPNRCNRETTMSCLLYVDYHNRGAQAPIERALAALGRKWDRFDLRGEGRHQANGIGNRLLGAGKYRLARGPIGPSNTHLEQYGVMLVNNGDLGPGTTFSDGGTGTPDDPSNDITFLYHWIHQGRWKGLWLSGNNIAADFALASTGPKPQFLEHTLGASLVGSSYREYVEHALQGESCRELHSNDGWCASENYFDQGSGTVFRLMGSGCPQMHDYDVITASGLGGGRWGRCLVYDNTATTHPPGAYASVAHIFPAHYGAQDTVRTLLDGFSVHYLRDYSSECDGATSIAWWIRSVLGGNDWTPGPVPPGEWAQRGYMFDRDLEFQYCPPHYEDTVTGVGGGPGRRYANALFQNYPNPFRSTSGTMIHYSAAKAGAVGIRIFDAAGRLVNTIVDKAEPGENCVVWSGLAKDGRRMASGVYFYEIRIDGYSAQKKMILVD
jgi:hypothetical protein